MPPCIGLRNEHILNVKTIGRETSCDLVLGHMSVSRQHARIELTGDGSVWVVDMDSRHGIRLKRNNAWIAVRRVMLCTGDSLRFGDYEVELQQLTAVFGKRAGVRLGEQYFPLRRGGKRNNGLSTGYEAESASNKPKRNPLTGQVEKDHL